MDPQQRIEDALSRRLSMQISLSSLPVVEEWMDAKLTRWLESIPMPMEMSRDGVANFIVEVSSDMERLLWGAHGTPSAFIPKLAEYLGKCAATPDDLARINGIGEAFEPTHVGSWAQVTPGKVTTGWQFDHEFTLDTLAPHFGESPSAKSVVSWLESAGLSVVSHVSAPLKTNGTFVLAPLSSVEEPASIAARAFSEFAPGVDATSLNDFLQHSSVENPGLGFSFGGDDVSAVVVVFSGVKSDDLPALCRSADVAYAEELGALANALGSDGIRTLVFSAEGGQARLSARYVPGAKPPPRTGN